MSKIEELAIEICFPCPPSASDGERAEAALRHVITMGSTCVLFVAARKCGCEGKRKNERQHMIAVNPKLASTFIAIAKSEQSMATLVDNTREWYELAGAPADRVGTELQRRGDVEKTQEEQEDAATEGPGS